MTNLANSSPAVSSPPSASKNLLSDIRVFVLNTPREKTLVKFSTPAEREDYSRRIMQRFGIEVGSYSVLNIHKISVDVPVAFIFQELLQWNGDSTCWPNHLARVRRINDRIEDIEILLFGRHIHFMGLHKPLFRLTAIRIQQVPSPSDYDNGRYLLYTCRGGYPIGVFAVGARSSIAQENETGQSQLIMGVGFDFYGLKKSFPLNPVNAVWEMIHNRVTANTLNRLKQLCEWRFEKIKMTP
jgi:hypothetical protein